MTKPRLKIIIGIVLIGIALFGFSTERQVLDISEEESNILFPNLHLLKDSYVVRNTDFTPKDRIEQDNINFRKVKVSIDLSKFNGKCHMSQYSNSDSMLPLLDKGHNGVSCVPNGPSDIRVGDVISFIHGNSTVVHRVVRVGQDTEGYFYLTKGDNLDRKDSVVTRYGDVVGVLVMIIY